ncbi:alpha-2-macroglobulin family protein, partial [Ideonella sp.]|uniref:alpha-2-macroglobulin family protein n=1 Tax=Ideonella sp. TaxID=1929293 RepID=UPI003BB67C0C
ELLITHQGSGEQIRQPLRWRDGAAAGSALSQWAIPNGAKLGSYQLSLVRGDREWPSGNFRVEAFRLPLVDARLTGPSGALVAPAELPLDVQLSYLNGGGLAQAPASVSALLRERINAPNGYEAFSFRPPVAVKPGGNEWDDAADAAEAPADKGRIVAERLPLRTDAKGAARVLLKPLPALTGPSELLTELTFTDPNGEVQTVSRSLALWSSAVQVGLRSRSWMARGGQAALQAVVLDPQGRPVAGQAVKISARLDKTLSTRKRMVGGFYAWEHHTRSTDLGAVCQGKTDARGLLDCDASLGAEAGQVQLTAEALDSQGRAARAADSVWVSGQGELWFAQDNDDRIDLLPEQAELQPGQTARLQVRMPFREATALVTVEREGLLHSQVVTLRGSQPVIELAVPGANDPAAASWAPNVYVSVLVLRGRVREVPWTSFFDWGWRTPREWWQAWRHEGPVWQPPTAMVDLAKPAFKLGVAALKIGQQAHRLDVQVQPDKTQYGVRQTARVTVTVRQNGQPAAGAQVAFAAVDEALLALRPNDSWNLLDAMFQSRGWGVETSTAQGEVIGRRHYGRKAVPAGGGGGRNPTRELFNTLLLWQPEVTLDARGQATLQVPLNDSLSRFRLVAVANAAGPRGGQAGVPDRFGTGSATLDVTQDLQILPGLPPLVREGDQFSATVTLRNTTGRSMKLLAQLSARGEPAATSSPAQPLKFADQTLTLAAGAAQELQWPVTVPAGLQRLQWQISAAEQGGAARDSLSLAQTVQPAVPLRIWQASLQPLAGPLRLPVAPPEGALSAEPGALPSGPGAKRGGVQLGLQASLAGPMPGVRRFFVDYPFNCLEQRASRAVGLQDAAAWTALMSELPAYLDSDGLAGYYPAPAGAAANGSDRLSAYLLSLANEAGLSLPDAQRERLLGGLTAFVEGRIERRFAAPRADLDVRKLAALEALSRHGR